MCLPAVVYHLKATKPAIVSCPSFSYILGQGFEKRWNQITEFKPCEWVGFEPYLFSDIHGPDPNINSLRIHFFNNHGAGFKGSISIQVSSVDFVHDSESLQKAPQTW